MSKRVLGAAAIAATTATLAIPSVAGANAGDRTFAQTFPVASRLCTEVAAGKRPHLKAIAPMIATDCATLLANFTAAQTAVLAARTSLGAQIAADQALKAAACPPALERKASCLNAKHTENAAIHALKVQRRNASRLYYKTIESDRGAFWHAIKQLRGLLHVQTDKPIRVQDH